MIGKNMKQQGYITDKYIQEMIDNIKKFGSYIVIEEGIAIPHGNISKNVMKNGISLLISKKKVFLPDKKFVKSLDKLTKKLLKEDRDIPHQQ